LRAEYFYLGKPGVPLAWIQSEIAVSRKLAEDRVRIRLEEDGDRRAVPRSQGRSDAACSLGRFHGPSIRARMKKMNREKTKAWTASSSALGSSPLTEMTPDVTRDRYTGGVRFSPLTIK